MNNLVEFCMVLNKLKPLSEYLSLFAKKYGVSSQAIILLYAISKDIDLTDFFKTELYYELNKAGFIEDNSGTLKITGKGAIIAKSIEIAIEKFVND